MDAGSRDLEKLIGKPLESMTWSTSPASHIVPIMKAGSVWQKLIELAPNGILPPAPTKKGIEACNAEGLVNFTKKFTTSAGFADHISVKLRQALAKLRSCKECPKSLAAAEKKLDHRSVTELHALLAAMNEFVPAFSPVSSPREASTARSTASSPFADEDLDIELDEEGFPDFSNLRRSTTSAAPAQMATASSASAPALMDGHDEAETASVTGAGQEMQGKGSSGAAMEPPRRSLAEMLLAKVHEGLPPLAPAEKRACKAKLQTHKKPAASENGLKRPAAHKPMKAMKKINKEPAEVEAQDPELAQEEPPEEPPQEPPQGPRAVTLAAAERDFKKKLHSRAYHAKANECWQASFNL